MIYSQKTLNKRLKGLYGSDITGKPRFRLVWTEDVFEVRKGDFNDFSPQGIFLRRFRGTRKAPKYSYLKDKYVLEVLVDYDAATVNLERSWMSKLMLLVHGANEDQSLVNGDGYEPVWVFQGKDKKFLTPHWKVIEIIVYSWLHRDDPSVKTPQISEEDLDNAEVKDLVMQFENESSDMSSQFGAGEAILMPGSAKTMPGTEITKEV